MDDAQLVGGVQAMRHLRDPANGVWVDTVKSIGEYVLKQRGSLGK